MAARFVLNPAGVKQVGTSTGMKAAMTEVADVVAEEVRAIGPRDDDPDPHYVDAIEVESGIDRGVAFARVKATKFTSNWIEFGTGGSSPTPAFAPVRRAVEAAGLHRTGGKQ